ncbi:CsbD family protein [Sneathiella sp. CAU 1612]|uniref:CsbD family protein n=1 Tax=Sneathiella sedimenti TaxID=2816034 RepID=A0ABS3FA49_9PROT|nr:CsbD family protein [Sneathiella sedimenti]MBO0335338.1 CsbD family protein [Sneathiella sedimenti]
MVNEDILKGKWKQIKGEAQRKWGKLTDDDLDEINGNREVFLGKIQENYGVAEEQAETMLEEFEREQAS